MRALSILLLSALCGYGQTMSFTGSGTFTGNGTFGVVTNAGGGGGDVKKDYNEGTGGTYNSELKNWNYYAYPFTASSSYTMHSVNIQCAQSTGVPSYNVTIEIRDDNAGSPGNVLTGGTSETRAGSTAPVTEGWWTFAGLTCAITSGTTNFITVHLSAYDTTNPELWYCEQISGHQGKHADTPGTWSDEGVGEWGRFQTFGQ